MSALKVQPLKTRREELRDRLLAIAEHAIATGGLGALKARDLATKAGCALGAIYTVFEDLDELILCVNARTLADLERALESERQEAGEAELQRLARAYLRYARRDGPRWRALFEHRLPAQKTVPMWYAQDLARLFALLEAPLKSLLPAAQAPSLAAQARVLFSAVHGIVLLGLEEKLAPTQIVELEGQLERFIATFGRGLKESS